jgi:pimeloyl-ACP methyl ester carboxylesterase
MRRGSGTPLSHERLAPVKRRSGLLGLAIASLLGAALAAPLVALAQGAGPSFAVRDGRKVAYHVTPGGSCALVLDAGGGLDSSYWRQLVPQLGRATGCRVITYDRAGLGASDPAPGPWRVESAAEDLAAVMRAAGATHGAVLVAHSLAGEIAFELVRRHPGWFAGAVLVDANVPEFFTDAVIEAQASAFAPAVAAARADPSTGANRELAAIGASFEQTSRAFHRATWPTAVPTVVIVSEKTPFDDAAAAELWREAHRRFAEAGPGRSLVVASGSSHDVAHDRPDVIVTAAESLLATGRGR